MVDAGCQQPSSLLYQESRRATQHIKAHVWCRAACLGTLEVARGKLVTTARWHTPTKHKPHPTVFLHVQATAARRVQQDQYPCHAVRSTIKVVRCL